MISRLPRLMAHRSPYTKYKAAALVSLLCLLLMTDSAVRADNHWQVSYSCSHSISTSGNSETYWLPESDSWTDTTPNDGDIADIGDTDGTFEASASDTVTATLTWVDDYGSPASNPPSKVLVQEEAAAEYNVMNPTDTLGDADADNGFSDSLEYFDNPTTTNPAIFGYDRISGVDTSRAPIYHYSVKDGSSGTITLTTRTLSASVNSTPAPPSDDNYGTEAWAGTYYAVATYSITIDCHSTVDTGTETDPWDPEHPRFFSGTDCSASASIDLDSSLISKTKLLINDTPVKQFPDPDDPYATPTLNVVFDSTHFSDATAITIKYQVWDSTNTSSTPTIDQTISADAYNEGYVLGNQSPNGQLAYGGAAVSDVATALGAVNYTVGSSTADNKAAILGNLAPPTAFYIWTHGLDFPSEFGDCYAYNTSSDSYYLFALASDDSTSSPGVTDAVNLKTVDQPPYNFVFIDACSTANSGYMAGAFGITPYSSDLAYLGYTTESDDSSYNEGWTANVLSDLISGDTINDAVTQTNVNYGYPENAGNHATTYIWGDQNLTLSGVYGGDGTAWFR